MKNNSKINLEKAQAAIEYMLLLAVVVAIVLIGFKTYLPRTQNSADLYFNRTIVGILGVGGRCGDDFCDDRFEDNEKCCKDCGGCP